MLIYFQYPALKAKQEEIQTKVIDILNKKNNILTTQNKPSPALNPALQQAIDSLVKSGPNLLNNIGKVGNTGGMGGSMGGEGNLGGYYANLFGGGSGSGSGGGMRGGQGGRF